MDGPSGSRSELGLVGERPPSARNNKQHLGTNTNHQPHSGSGPPDWTMHKPNQNQSYTDRILDSKRQDTVRSNTSFNIKQRNYTQTRCATPKHGSHKESYVDETLFGSARSVPGEPSWDFGGPDKSHTPIIKGTYKKPTSSRPGTPQRPSSRYGKRGFYKTTSYGSAADEALFGKGNAPTDFQPSRPEYGYDCYGNRLLTKPQSSTETRMTSWTAENPRPGSAAGSRPGSAAGSRPGSAAGFHGNRSASRNESQLDFSVQGSGYNSARSSARPESAAGSGRRVPFEDWMHQSKNNNSKLLPTKYQVFSSSYVDESLFGPKPIEADFPAPWENEEEERKKGKPFLFDTNKYTTHFGNPDVAIKEKGPYLRKPIIKDPKAKPVWK